MKKTFLFVCALCFLLTGCVEKKVENPQETPIAESEIQTEESSVENPFSENQYAEVTTSPAPSANPQQSEKTENDESKTESNNHSEQKQPETESKNTSIAVQQTAKSTPTPTPVPDPESHMSDMYIDIIKSNNYFMKAKVSDESGINEFAVSVNGNNTAMETSTNGLLYNTVIKDGITYMIDHQNKLVITSGAEVANSASNMAADSLSTDGVTFAEKGTGDFSGEKMNFESYNSPNGGKMRFYFRGNVLAGIESEEDGKTTTYQIEEISGGHRANMHEIPSDYQVLDMAALGG